MGCFCWKLLFGLFVLFELTLSSEHSKKKSAYPSKKWSKKIRKEKTIARKAAELHEKKFTKTIKIRFQGPCPKDKSGFIEEVSKQFKCIKSKPGPTVKKFNSWYFRNPTRDMQTFFVYFIDDETDVKESIKNEGNQLLVRKKKYYVVHDECNICFYTANEGAEIILLSCNPLHMSCKNCIDNFQNKTCPWCKKAITRKREIFDKIIFVARTSFLAPVLLLWKAGGEFSTQLLYYYRCACTFEVADMRTGIRDLLHVYVVPELVIMILNYLRINDLVNIDMNAKWQFVVWIVVWNINKQLRKKLKWAFSDLQLYIILNQHFYFAQIFVENGFSLQPLIDQKPFGTSASGYALKIVCFPFYMFWRAMSISLPTQLYDLQFLVFAIVASTIASLPSFTPIFTSIAFLTMQYFSGDFYPTGKKLVIDYFGKNPSPPYGRITYNTGELIMTVEYAVGFIFLIESYRIYQKSANANGEQNVWNLDWKKMLKRPFELWWSGFTSYGKIFLSLILSIFGFKKNISPSEVFNFGRALLIPEMVVIVLNFLHITPTFDAKGSLLIDFAFWFFADFFNKFLTKNSKGKIGFTDFQLSIFLSSWMIGGTFSMIFFIFRFVIFQPLIFRHVLGFDFSRLLPYMMGVDMHLFPCVAVIAILASLLSFHPLFIPFIFGLTGTTMMFWGDEHYSNAKDLYFRTMPAEQTLPYSSIQYDPKSLLFSGKLAVYSVIFQNTAAPVIKLVIKAICNSVFENFIQIFPVDFTT